MLFNEDLRSLLRMVRDGRLSMAESIPVLRQAIDQKRDIDVAELEDHLLLRQAIERYRGPSISIDRSHAA